MRMLALAFWLVGAITLLPPQAAAEISVIEVALSEEILDQQPRSPAQPSAYCEKDHRGQETLPIIDSSSGKVVYFWSRVKSTRGSVLRHTWFMNTGHGWKQVAQVDLNIFTSPGFRAWSSKEIAPAIHVGEWMVVVSTAEEPNTVHCIVRFRVV